MKFTISSLIAIGAAALAIGVPAAVADSGLDGGAPVIDVAQTPDWFERAAAAGARNGSAPYLDAFERPAALVQTSALDWFERAAASAVRDAPAPYVDGFERSTRPASTIPITSLAVDSGTDIAWGQIGLAFGLGLMLALGLGVAFTLPRRAATVGHES